MHQILDSRKEERIVPLFRLGFRPFFLFGALFSALAMLGWLGQLNGWFALPGISNPIWWHAHEMLFGFGAAIVAGFSAYRRPELDRSPRCTRLAAGTGRGIVGHPERPAPWFGESNVT